MRVTTLLRDTDKLAARLSKLAEACERLGVIASSMIGEQSPGRIHPISVGARCIKQAAQELREACSALEQASAHLGSIK